MTVQSRPLVSKLVKIGSAAILIAAVFALFRGGAAGTGKPEGRGMSTPPSLPTTPLASALPDLVTYCVGFGLAMALTIAAFALVHWHWAPPPTALAIVFGLGLVQIVVHFRCFLHVTLDGPARDDLQLILFSTLIVLLMVGGTLVVLFNLRMRMM